MTWENAQGVEPSTLENMCMSERFDDPIDTPMKSHDDQHEERTRHGAHRSKRRTIDEHRSFGWAHRVHVRVRQLS
jgi:hypothetical protein